MKKYLVIGNPIEHSSSPELHNYWIKKNNIKAIYEKKFINEDGLENLISQVKQKKISGMNVTIPFKKKIIPFLDKLTVEAKATESVNTIYLNNNEVTGHNTDIEGFKTSIEKSEFDLSNKKVFILGAGGVVSSIIYALDIMGASKITVSNRTRKKAEELKNLFKNLNIVEWGEIPNFDMIINATSLGLKKDDKIDFNFSSIGQNKFFYDVIYNPKETNFLKIGNNLGNKTLNGKLMFIYQAFEAFNTWHRLKPEINEDVIRLLD